MGNVFTFCSNLKDTCEHETNWQYKSKCASMDETLLTQGDFDDHYELQEMIGINRNGSTCVCHCCKKIDTNETFACKIINKQLIQREHPGFLKQFETEILALQSLDHPNIIQLVDVFETDQHIYMVTELAHGGELFDYIVDKGTMSESEASHITRKTTAALAHIHASGIIHRDLKPENVLLKSKNEGAEVKIIDFGLAKVDSNDISKDFRGTHGYLAPEVILRQSCTKSVDIWALGVIVYILLCQCLPFGEDCCSITSVKDAKEKFSLRFPDWASGVSDSAKDLLRHLLEVDSNKRYTADQALSHPWVTGQQFRTGFHNPTCNNYSQSVVENEGLDLINTELQSLTLISS